MAELLVVGFDVAANGEQLFALGHVDAGSDGDLFAGEVEVEAAAGGLFQSSPCPPDALMDLIGALVGAEANVAIDAHHGFLRRLDVFGSEAEHGFVDRSDESDGRGFELALVDGLAIVEPVTGVVALEAAKKLDGLGVVVRSR